MNDALLVRFEEHRGEFIHDLAEMYLNYLKASTAWQYEKHKEEFVGYLDSEEIENRAEIARFREKGVEYSSGAFLASPVFQGAIAKMEFDGEKAIVIIRGLYHKYEKSKEEDKNMYWWPMMYPIEKIIGQKIKGYCFPFDFEVIEWNNAGLFSKGSATMRYKAAPFVREFLDDLLEIAKQDGTNIEIEADAPANENPISSEVREILFDGTFTIESKRIKGKTRRTFGICSS